MATIWGLSSSVVSCGATTVTVYSLFSSVTPALSFPAEVAWVVLLLPLTTSIAVIVLNAFVDIADPPFVPWTHSWSVELEDVWPFIRKYDFRIKNNILNKLKGSKNILSNLGVSIILILLIHSLSAYWNQLFFEFYIFL